MGRLKINISGLMAIVFVLAVAFASLRAHSNLGVKLVLCIALALNFAAVAIIAIDLGGRIRSAALAYAIAGWGWLAMETFLPWTDSLVSEYLITPGLIKLIDPDPNPNAPGPHPLIFPLSLVTHSLFSIVSGSVAAFLAWTFTPRFFDHDRSTTPTSDPS
jgi:hypothetical protein